VTTGALTALTDAVAWTALAPVAAALTVSV
jgi:hypothetical protein